MSSTRSDFIIIGSGINSLVCAALIGRTGKSVCIVERAERAGGCIRSEELTAPGFIHDTLSGWHPLFVLSPAYAELGPDLHKRGLTYLNTDTPTASVTPSGESIILSTSREANLETFDALHPGDAAGYVRSLAAIESSAELTFGLLGAELRRLGTLRLLFKEFRRRGLQGTVEFFGEAMGSCRGWLNTHFESELARTLFAPWILHTGLSPDAAISGHMGKLIAFSLETAGMPVVEGGSYQLVAAFLALLKDQGGRVECNADARKILVNNGKAVGVRTADGRQFEASEAVICNVTPTQLYGQLLAKNHSTTKLRDAATSYRYGRADMQIHLALDAPPQWVNPDLNNVPMVHLTEGLTGITRSIAEANSGLLPALPTLVVGQPIALDPSRAPKGKWILWIQLQELPRVVLGDALAEIKIPESGEWTDELREQFADRVLQRLALVIPNLHASILARTVLSPRDLESMNMNLVGGDPYSGDCSIDQFFLWRPLPTTKNHETPIDNLYHIGASTHPGPGLGGGSGYMLGKLLS